MTTRLLSFVGLSLCITGSVWAQGMQRSIMPPPTSIFPASSLQGSVASTGPRWSSQKKTQTDNGSSKTTQTDNGSSLSSTETVIIKIGNTATYAPFDTMLGHLTNTAEAHTQNLNRIVEGKAEGQDKLINRLSERYKKSPSQRKRIAVNAAKRGKETILSNARKPAETAAKGAKFLSTLGTVLNILDFVSVAAQGAAYLAEGDTTGAAGVMAGEITKKTSEGIGAFTGSFFVPVAGSIAGAMAGNEVWERNIKPEIEKREQTLREAEYLHAKLNKPWLKHQQFIDSTGSVRDLEDDQYVERGSGLVRRRTPEEQAGFERAEYTQWRNKKTWEQINKDHADGKIDDERLAELQVSYAGRSLVDPWQPSGLSFVELPTPSSKEEPIAKPSQTELIAEITPIQLTASGSTTESIEGYTILTNLEFAFWNLGNYSPEHNKAILKITSSHDETLVLVGTFSGGPNGTLRFSHEGEIQTFQVRNGTHLIAEVERLSSDGSEIETVTLTLPLSNPSAFADWPKNLQ